MESSFIPPVANPTTRHRISGKVMIIIAVIVFALIVGAGLLIALSARNPVEPMDRLNTRMDTLVNMAKEGTKSARDPRLVKINSDASILLTGDAAALKQALGSVGAKGTSKTVVAAEKAAGKDVIEQLKKASVDGRFDREYKTVMGEQLSNAQQLLTEVNVSSSNTSVKAATKAAYDHCQTIINSLSALSL